jgi:hypothetical protein
MWPAVCGKFPRSSEESPHATGSTRKPFDSSLQTRLARPRTQAVNRPRFLLQLSVLALDYGGTIACNDVVSALVREAIAEARASGSPCCW